MRGLANVRLPGGAWQEGRRCQEAAVGQPSGADEAFIAETDGSTLPALRATELLARLVRRLGDREPGAAELRGLTVGDRETLLLSILKALTGGSVDCLVGCPACGERLEVGLELDRLLLGPYGRWEQAYEETVETESGRWRVTFRLPTGGDQEEVASLALADLERGTAALLRRCLLDVEPGLDGADAPASLAAAISRRMADLDPQAEVELVSACPECERRILAPFDALAFLTQMVEGGRAALIGEVDLLARAYHWTEDQILAVPRRRRREYARAARGLGATA